MKPFKQFLKEQEDPWKDRNCYEYAAGCTRNTASRVVPAVPGAAGGSPMKNYSMDELRRGLEADGAIHAGSGTEPPPPKDGHHLVYAVTSYGTKNPDFHFYTHQNGSWSHRFHNELSTEDASGKPIENPATADRDYRKKAFNGIVGGGPNYHTGAFFYIPKGMKTKKAVPPPKG